MNTAEKIKVMQAWADGKTIQIAIMRNGVGWSDWNGGEPEWNWNNTSYRIKPAEPREYIIILDGSGNVIGAAKAGRGQVVKVPPDLNSIIGMLTVPVKEVITS